MASSGWCLTGDHAGCRYRLCTCACHPPTWTQDRDAAATRTITFGLDGQGYEMDLDAERAAQLRAALAPYIARARS